MILGHISLSTLYHRVAVGGGGGGGGGVSS